MNPTSRFDVPGLPAPYVHRPAVSDALDKALSGGPALIVGGPGWGKTTAAAAWAAGRPVGWLALESGDASVLRLADRIRNAARHVLPDLPADRKVTGRTNGRAGGPVDVAVRALNTMLAGHLDGDLVVVLDGLEMLPPAGESSDLVARLCRSGPPGLRLMLVARRVPGGWFAAAGHSSAAEIGPASLAFATDEITALLAASGRPEPEQVAQVWSLTSGWPAAVCLVAEAIRVAAPGPPPAAAMRTLLDPLAGQALEQEPVSVRRLLRVGAVLGVVDVPLGEALGHGDAATVLPALARQGLLQAEDPRASSWSVIPPVRDLLVRGGNAGSRRARRASGRVSQARYGPALRLLVARGNRRAVERLLVEYGESLLAQGEVEAVVDAAKLLDIRSADSRILTVLGRALQAQGDWLEALTRLEAAAGDNPNPAVALWLGQHYYLSGRTDRAIELYERARTDEPVSPDSVRLLCEAVVWLRAAGQDDAARLAAARGAEAAERCADPAVQATCHRVQAVLAAHEGDRSANNLHHQRAVRLAIMLGDDRLHLTLLINRASYLAEEGAPTDALTTIDAALQMGVEHGLGGYEPFCYSIRGRAKARLGRFDEALADVEAAQALWDQIGPCLDIPFGLLVRGDVHGRRGEPGQAKAALEEALRLTTDTAGMRPLRSGALSTLARARAADDLDAARDAAERSVALATGTGKVPALLARGWIALLSGERAAAQADAAQASTVAGMRRDHGGLAEAIELAVLSAPRPADAAAQLVEAAKLWRDLCDPVSVARIRLIAARLAGPSQLPEADAAAADLRALGVRIDSGVAGALAVPVAQPRVTVQTLGGFQVLRAGVPVPGNEWKSRKARDFFKILVAQHGQPLSRDQLSDLLWPGDPDTGNRFAVLLNTVRNVLSPDRSEPNPIRSDRGAVSLDLSLISVDLETFLSTANAALDAHLRRHADAPVLLHAAAALYKGDFLPEDLYTEWLRRPRDHARSTHVAVLQALTRHTTDPDQRELYLLQLLDHDRYDEQSHRRLINTLLGAGRFGAARRRYESYVEAMADIGVDPYPWPPPRPD